MLKVCKKCNIEKSVDEFGNNKTQKDGKKIYCRECELKRAREYRGRNREKVNESARLYRINSRDKYNENVKRYLEKNPHMTSGERYKRKKEDPKFVEEIREYHREWRKKNIEKVRKNKKEYYHNNKEKLLRENNEYKKNRRKTDGFYRMKLNLRNRIRDYLNGRGKSKRTMEIVGMNEVEFKDYIEKKFVDDMTWDNYGKWHLDHITPLCEANNPEEALLLNHYTNLQPLWGIDNIKKNRKV